MCPSVAGYCSSTLKIFRDEKALATAAERFDTLAQMGLVVRTLGRDEVVAGQRGGTRSLILYTASKDGATWTRRVLDEGGMAGAACAAADLNADKRPDIVCIGTATANVKWYENLGTK